MSFIRSLVNSGARIMLSFSALKLASLVKVSFIVGSSLAFFSGSCVAMPLIGAFGGTTIAGLVLVFSGLARMVFGGAIASYVMYHIPGICAAGYWNTHNRVIKIALPISCMIAFIVHPVGGQAWTYSLYWLIPAIIACKRFNGIFLQALATTFIAHAVGSVIWIYTVPMTAVQWISLIPVVAIERLLFATSIALVYSIVLAAKPYFSYYCGQTLSTAAQHPLLKRVL